MAKPQLIRSLLAQSNALTHLVDTIDRVSNLSDRIRRLLEPSLAEHCQIANVREHTIIMQVEGTVWSNRLRYQIPHLLQVFQNDPDLAKLHHIQIRVCPPTLSGVPNAAAIRLSKEAAATLQAAADATAEPELKAALARLAGRSRD